MLYVKNHVFIVCTRSTISLYTIKSRDTPKWPTHKTSIRGTYKNVLTGKARVGSPPREHERFDLAYNQQLGA